MPTGPMITVGTVSLPLAIERTIAASSGLSQIFRSFTAMLASARPELSLAQNGQPGRQKYSIASISPGGVADRCSGATSTVDFPERNEYSAKPKPPTRKIQAMGSMRFLRYCQTERAAIA